MYSLSYLKQLKRLLSGNQEWEQILLREMLEERFTVILRLSDNRKHVWFCGQNIQYYKLSRLVLLETIGRCIDVAYVELHIRPIFSDMGLFRLKDLTTHNTTVADGAT